MRNTMDTGAPPTDPAERPHQPAVVSPPEPAPGIPASEVVVSVDHLTKVFVPSPPWLKFLLKSAITSPVTALENVSFELRRGETCVVIGPNGAGKSTLFRILIGLTTPTSGRASVLGNDISAGRRVRSLIGYMPPEGHNLMLRHTCAQNLEFRGRLQGMSRSSMSARIDEVLEQVGLSYARNQAATSLSTGQKARLQLAAALLHRPKVLILDEPTSAVDPVGAHELLLLIEELTVSDGLSVVISSHRLEEIDALEDNVVFLDHGRVIHYGNLRTLRSIWEIPRYRLEFATGVDQPDIARLLDRQPEIEVDVVAGLVEVTTRRPIGEVLASLGPASASLVSVERAMMPLRVLFHKLISGEIEGKVPT